MIKTGIRIRVVFLLFLAQLMLLGACTSTGEQPGHTATPASATPPTQTTPATAVFPNATLPAATPIMSPTPLTATAPGITPSIPTPSPTPGGCLPDPPAANQPPAGALRVLYELDGQLWEWREETEQASPIPPPTATTPESSGYLSANGRFLASLRQPDDNTFEVWLSEADGSQPYQLLAVTPDDMYERYPQATGAQLQVAWVGNTSLLSYHFSPQFDEIGQVPVQTLRVVDAEDGRLWTLLPPDVAWTYQFTQEGQQLIALSQNGIQIISVQDGTIQFEIPLDVVVPFEQGITFLPEDNTQIFVYTQTGLALVHLEDGTVTELPIAYQPVGAGHYSILPLMHWLANKTQFYLLTTADEVWNNPDATFTIWLVDTTIPDAAAINTFTGFYLSVVPSPTWQRLAFWTQTRNNVRQLYLADVMSGQQFLYDRLPELEFIGWSANETQFLYKPFASPQPIVGHICAPPRPLTDVTVAINAHIRWVDDQRLLVLEGQPGTGQTRPLRLHTIDGPQTLIATLSGDYPLFDFYFETGRK